jgi:hypothetical protein
MAWGSHKLLKVSLGPALLYPSKLYGQANPETAFWPFQGRPARKTGGLQPSFTPMDPPRSMPMSVGSEIPSFHNQEEVSPVSEPILCAKNDGDSLEVQLWARRVPPGP